MTFVDDVRAVFDASEFCSTITSSVGEGRATSEKALRDTNAATAALAALTYFHEQAKSRQPPDVIAAYVSYSSGATELFNALRAVSVHRSIAEAALDCLTSIVRYSLDPNNPLQALEATRSIVKDVVRSGAVLILNVFSVDSKSCARKALNLLRLVAQCHPVLAKEIVNRFNLGADNMASALCSESNNLCRVPFLDLMFVLLASGDYDIARAFSTRLRGVLLTCLKVVKMKTLRESNPDHPHVVVAERRNSNKRAKNPKMNGISGRQGKPNTVLPSHVQKRELIAAINFLLAVERHLLYSPNKGVCRAVFASPMMDILASIASAEIPPLSIVPRQVVPEHEALRATASAIFIKVATDRQIGNMYEIVSALSTIIILDTKPVVEFVVHVIEEQPLLSSRLLESGLVIPASPTLSSSWFGYIAIICACVPRLSAPVTRFSEKQFFEKCLSHKEALVREMGALVLRMLCKVVHNNASARLEPQKYLPSVKCFQDFLKKGGTNPETTYKLMSSYQELFEGNAEESRLDLLKLSIDTAGDDVGKAEESIRSALTTDPGGTVRAAFSKKYFSTLAACAMKTRDKRISFRRWRLCHDILAHSGLFPCGTEAEIDIYLALLSSMGNDLSTCALELEKMLDSAHRNPYGLFDELQRVATTMSTEFCKTSLVSIAAVFRLKKLQNSNTSNERQRNHDAFTEMLSTALTTVIAVYQLMGFSNSINWFKEMLSTAVQDINAWWTESDRDSKRQNVTLCYQAVQRFVLSSTSYPDTPFMQLLQTLSLHSLAGSTLVNGERSTKSAVLLDGTLWKAGCGLLLGGSTQDVFSRTHIVSPWLQGNDLNSRYSLLLNGLNGSADEMVPLGSVTELKGEGIERNMASVIGILLRVLRNGKSRSIVARMAVDILSKPEVQVDGILKDFIQESLLKASMCERLWIQSEDVKMLVLFATSRLQRISLKYSERNQITFSAFLLVQLCIHPDVNTRLRAQRHLLYDSNPDFLPLDVLSDAAPDLRSLITFYPALRSYIVRQITQWSAADFSSLTIPLLPVLQDLLIRCRSSPDDSALDISFADVPLKVLDALRIWDYSQVPAWAENCQEIFGDILGNVGEVLASSKNGIKAVASFLKQSCSAAGKFEPSAIWFFLQSMFKSEKEVSVGSVMTDIELVNFVSSMLKWFSLNQIQVSNQRHCKAMVVFTDSTAWLRRRKIDIYGLTKDSASLEKGLTALCSNILKAIHEDMNSYNDGVANGGESDNILINNFQLQHGAQKGLLCIRGVLMLDLLLDKAAKRTIMSLSAHSGGILMAEAQCDRLPSSRGDLSRADVGYDAIATLNTALVQLPRFGLDKEVADGLSILEGVLSAERFSYGAGMRKRDQCIRECMDGIATQLTQNGAREKFSLPERRAGLFASSPSQALSILDKRKLATTHEQILAREEPNADVDSVLRLGQRRREQAGYEPYDPIFVLKTFLLACHEAVKSPGRALLDIGKVAKEGVLGLAITGLASDNDEVRLLSYCCVEMFAKVVGPQKGVHKGSAASLYKDRKQLAFLLSLLRNSINSELPKMLPLFTVWFRVCLRIALTPIHEAYKAVTYFFMRSPSLDVYDCPGVAYLLQCDASGSELPSVRRLGLYILRHGVRSVSDRNVLRKRKIMDSVFMLGGGYAGADNVRREIPEMLATIISRDKDIEMSTELLSSHGLLSWLLPDPSTVDELSQLVGRLKVLTMATLACAVRSDAGRFARRFSRALASIVKTLQKHQINVNWSILVELVNLCACFLCRLYPCQRGLLLFNLADLNSDRLSSLQRSDEKMKVAMAIARQDVYNISSEVFDFLIESSVLFSGNYPNQPLHEIVLGQDNSVEVAMIHAFLLQILFCVRGAKLKLQMSNKSILLLAEAMTYCPTVWLTVACICILEMKDRLPEEVERRTADLPGYVAKSIDITRDKKYETIVNDCQSAIIDSLLRCAEVE